MGRCTVRCDVAQRGLSDRLDDETPVDSASLERHVEDCAACAAFAHELGVLRRRLRISSLEPPPDIASAVRRRLERVPAAEGGSPRTQRPAELVFRAAAVFLLAFTLTATAVGLTGPPDAGAVEIDRLVRTGQHRVDALVADLTVTEHGWHPRVSERRYVGSLAYGAPERFQLVLDDRTVYPSASWHANDVALVIEESRSWSRGSVGCPTTSSPACHADHQQVRVVTGREPFDDGDPLPLELVVPVDSFGLPTGGAPGPTAEVGGREVVVTDVPVSQVGGLLAGMTSVGDWREVHASDRVQVALDVEFGVPLSVTVRASDEDQRRRWAAARGYEDDPGATLLSWQLTNVVVNDPGRLPAFPPAPEDPDVVIDRGSRPDGDTRPLARPDDLARHRSASTGPVLVQSWTDGRAWLRIRSHPSWDRDRLFGRRGSLLVRRVALASGGVAYVAEGGDEVFLHSAGGDVHLRGSIGTAALLQVADRLDPTGRPVPSDWVEASSATVHDARGALPGLLEPAPLPGFRGPAVRIDHGLVMLAYAGNGDRGFVLTQAPGELLSPPFDDDVIGLSVRDRVGRFTPSTGTLEWVEDGLVVSLRSHSLALGELLAVAQRLEVGP